MTELLLVIFLLSGIIKDFLEYFKINSTIDFTLISATALIIVLVLKYIRQQKIIVPVSKKDFISIVLILIFWAWMAFSLIYSKSVNYAYLKTFNFGTIVLAIISIAVGKIDIQKFIRIFIFINAVIISIFFPIHYHYLSGIEQSKIASRISTLYLVLGQNLGIILLCLWFTKSIIFNKQLDKLLIIITLASLIFIGARGPLIFAAILIIARYIIGLREKNILKFRLTPLKIIILVIILLILITLTIIYFQEIKVLIEQTIYRFSFLLDSKSNSVGQRLEHLNKSWKLLHDPGIVFFGTGIGAYSISTSGIDSRAYPHNIFLEILIELGIIGLVLFIFFIIIQLLNGKKNAYISLSLIIYILLNMLTSSSIIDIRIYVSFLMLYSQIHKFKKIISNPSNSSLKVI